MKIEQVLHGYSNGHTLLRSSVKSLTVNDAAKMDVLSDWSGYQDDREDSSYITTYPLVDSPYYVVAKSWYAYEMDRPGCVWTHSLLISFDDIDKKFDFRLLLVYFSRPSSDDLDDYEQTIEIDRYPSFNGQKDILPIDETSLIFLYSSLFAYSKPFSFKVEMSALDNQKFCLSLLQYLPIPLLRHISMSSGSNNLRQFQGEVLTMQFVSDKSMMSLLSPPWKDTVKIDDFHNGVRFLLQEVLNGGNSIAPLIRIFSNDIGTNYGKLCAVGNLLRMLNRAMLHRVSSDDYQIVLRIMSLAFPSDEGMLIKSNFLGAKIVPLFGDDSNFIYQISICENGEAFPESFVRLKSHFEIAIKDFDKLYSIVEKIYNYGTLSHYGIEFLGMFFSTSTWINLGREEFGKLLNIFEKYYDISWDGKIGWYNIWAACLRYNTDVSLSIADLIRSKLIQPEIIVYENLNNGNKTPKNMVKSTFSNVECFLEWMSFEDDFSDQVVNAIVTNIVPTSVVVKRKGSKIWNWLANNKHGISLDYYAFVFTLSFNWTDDIALKLLKCSFYPIHQILAEDRVHAPILWLKVMKFADELPIEEDWDNCKKLRKGLVRYLKSCGYKKTLLSDFTPDVGLNDRLVKFW